MMSAAARGPKGTATAPLDGGALTLGWTRAPAKGAAAAPPLLLAPAAVVDSLSRAVVERQKIFVHSFLKAGQKIDWVLVTRKN
ncbi:hypothetical protein EJB05_08134, partial [Eragrostis curvula]